ncbi:LSU ribosomal protein L15P [Hydrogenivirga caldilitoris]|uniref:Large ribosomal subunit protein uL15 n=1 Tax=Hydrogenivirga caldilitoris TaxID=246264 RepID=A0A497XNC9_9AQUI|nr:50S ribosomal protein L15 [Hydrogenivirga caldilitoris]RLJ69814.1 LSU ribosomal protein L15P [Hydrogenivirga caldilitoris]
MKLHELQPHPGATKEKKRVGRGIAAGQGKTAGKGHKGQKTRSGDRTVPAYFEGGQTPLHQRIPKRGFTSPNRKEYIPVNVGTLEKLFEDGAEITPEALSQRGICSKGDLVKVLGDGELKKKFTVKAHAFSKSAKEKIEKAGGTCEVIGK